MIEPNLPEFRRHMGPLVEGKTDAEVAEMHATLQWVADQAIAHALREPQRTPHLLRSA